MEPSPTWNTSCLQSHPQALSRRLDESVATHSVATSRLTAAICGDCLSLSRLGKESVIRKNLSGSVEKVFDEFRDDTFLSSGGIRVVIRRVEHPLII